MSQPKTREEAEIRWRIANQNYGCTCSVNPPCAFCVNGFTLPLDEYLDTFDFEEESPDDAYDRAMTVI